jgi:hypothetical protein
MEFSSLGCLILRWMVFEIPVIISSTTSSAVMESSTSYGGCLYAV